MTDFGPIVLAAIGVLSLAVTGLLKAIDVLGKRRAAKSIPPPAVAADASGSYGRPVLVNDLDPIIKQLDRMEKKTDDLHEWHDVHDPQTGIKSWLVSPEWLTLLKAIEKHMANQEVLMKHLAGKK